MTARLEVIVRDVRARAAQRRAKQSLARLEEIVRPDPWRRERFLMPFTPAKPGEHHELAIIAELVRRSPASGPMLREDPARRDVRPTRVPAPGPRWFALAQAYQRGGAAALSVATEEDHFEGSLDDLRAVEFTRLPRLRKDFILDDGMVYESCVYGADAIVLLAVALDDGMLARLCNVARELGLAVCIEVHDERELERALAVEPELVGVSALDWNTFQVDLATVERVLPRVPSGPVKLAMGGLAQLDDLVRVRRAGADAVLVGESLIASTDAQATLSAWRAALHDA